MALEWRNKCRMKQLLVNIYKPGRKILVFDVETTGLGETSKVIQFSGILYQINSDGMLDECVVSDMYINPEEPIKEKITEITGITDEILKDALKENDVIAEIMDLFNQCDMIAGYNVSFDIDQIKRMAKRTGNVYRSKPFIDVCEMSRDWVEKQEIKEHKLGNVAKYLFPEQSFAFHDSLEDVKATAKILELLVKKYQEYEYDSNKSPAHLEKAHLFINPRKPSQQRICLKLSVGEDGDIFYDIPGHFWSCKSTTMAKKLFKTLDLQGIENQVHNKYIAPFKYDNIDDMAKGWLKFRRDKMKERKETT